MGGGYQRNIGGPRPRIMEKERHIKSKSKARKLRDSYCDGYKEMTWDSDKEKVMKKFIGTKTLHGKPMSLGEYNIYRGWTIPENEDPDAPGHLVRYEDGYESWSPAEAFKAYRPIDGMTFGLAIEVMKKGEKVARVGWNGVGIFCALQEPDDLSFMSSPYFFIDTTGLSTNNPAAPKCRVPWHPSQTDMQAEDWFIVG